METMETPTTKPKVYIHLIRHAHAECNYDPTTATQAEKQACESILDPGLTPHGYDEALHLRHQFPYMKDLTYIFTSPLNRALLTTIKAFQPAMSAGIKPIVLPELREAGRGPTSTGYDRHGILNGVGPCAVHFNTDMLEEGWEVNTAGKGESVARAHKVRCMLEELADVLMSQDPDPKPRKLKLWKDFAVSPLKNGKDVHIAVVSHGDILRKIAGKPPDFDKGPFHNAEFRTYMFRGMNERGPLADGQKTSDLVQSEKSLVVKIPVDAGGGCG
ncbi:hypothetical protein VTL71DRAFT_12069 [Oculimacula yallundae]|uniref:Phosphoglycerate mutase family protein n=1 Tax=Oculimacula yallundae TaxID=86028 RepID=A0ABR4CTI0_9HELO